MKKTRYNAINTLNRISSRMPRTINEAINFNEDDDMDMYGDEESMEEPQDEEPEAHESEGGMDVMAFVDDIRKKSLKGMAQLAENPDDERYQLLKKIWQICDKKPEQQTAFNNPNQQQQQQQQPMQNPHHGRM